MTLFEWQGLMVERAANTLAHFVSQTKPDRLTWKPSADSSSDTRDIMDQVNECIRVNRVTAAILRDETAVPPEPLAERDALIQALRDSGKELADAICKLDDGARDRIYETPRMGSLRGAILMELPAANMHYHAGQVNYIQLLYGDTEFSIPPGFM